jgi:hypothetical protein
MGHTGLYLRNDYAVDCNGDEYKNHVPQAVFGIFLYPIGIPLLFYYIISKRESDVFRTPAALLSRNFEDGWMYFEVYDLIRRLFVTSLQVFVGGSSSPSRALYLFVVEVIALVILAFCRPYAMRSDDILSSAFIAVECTAFLIALLVLSGQAASENYHTTGMYETLLWMLIATIFILGPFTFALKFKRPNLIVYKMLGIKTNSIPNQRWSSLTPEQLKDAVADVRSVKRDSRRLSMVSNFDARESQMIEMSPDNMRQSNIESTRTTSTANPIVTAEVFDGDLRPRRHTAGPKILISEMISDESGGNSGPSV